jgi:predicted dehydrogenase
MAKTATKWAMIGTGGMALKIIRDFKRTESVELTTIVSRSLERGLTFATEWEVPKVLVDLERLWDERDIDVVYIATPNSEHHGLARAALQAHKHVVVEKPITTTAEEARELVALARAAEWARFRFSHVPRPTTMLDADVEIGTRQLVVQGRAGGRPCS